MQLTEVSISHVQCWLQFLATYSVTVHMTIAKLKAFSFCECIQKDDDNDQGSELILGAELAVIFSRYIFSMQSHF